MKGEALRFDDFLESFQGLLESSPTEEILPASRYVILSDLHMGDGGKRDDLLRNRAILRTVLREHYLKRGYTLILAGDVEELHKFRLPDIRRAWATLYSVFDAFAARNALRKLVGNHDLALLKEGGYPYELSHGLRLTLGGRTLFCFHGHQASRFFVKFNYLSDFIVRYIAKPLRIKNTSISKDSRQRFKAERRIYRASKRLGILSIAGHTHRPLFESLSKYDSLRFALEALVKEFPYASASRREEIARVVSIYKGEFRGLRKKERKEGLSRGLYEDRDFATPCVFNSGCATGAGGFTAIEISGGEGSLGGSSIALVRWSEGEGAKAYIEAEAEERSPLEATPYIRYVLRKGELEAIFARMELLGDEGAEGIAY